MPGRSSKTKGSVFERELANYLSDKTGLAIARAPLSGGGHVGPVEGAGGADLLGATGLFIEAKRVERLNFPDAMAQAQRNATKTTSRDAPVVINRRNRQSTGDSYVLLTLDNFLAFYNAWLRQEGFAKDGPPSA